MIQAFLPAELSEAEIDEIVDGYALVAEHCAEGGFDLDAVGAIHVPVPLPEPTLAGGLMASGLMFANHHSYFTAGIGLALFATTPRRRSREAARRGSAPRAHR